MRSDRTLARGVSVVGGKVTYEPVAEALGHPFVPLSELVPLGAPV